MNQMAGLAPGHCKQHKPRVTRRKLADLESFGPTQDAWERVNTAIDNELLTHFNRRQVPTAFRHAFEES